jgi:hypothetical protein
MHAAIHLNFFVAPAAGMNPDVAATMTSGAEAEYQKRTTSTLQA